MPTNTISITDKCAEVINTPGVQITSIEGRERGKQINFLNYTYDDLKMRRKAEVLKRNTTPPTIKGEYAYASRYNYYSQAKIKEFLNKKIIDCPDRASSSSCSGVVGSTTIYYLDRKIPYFSSI
jgi:hypothetical protein